MQGTLLSKMSLCVEKILILSVQMKIPKCTILHRAQQAKIKADVQKAQLD